MAHSTEQPVYGLLLRQPCKLSAQQAASPRRNQNAVGEQLKVQLRIHLQQNYINS
jgi:hypothetical protein